jgi:hypothetical protein
MINNIAKMMCGIHVSEKIFFLLIDLSIEILDGGNKEL